LHRSGVEGVATQRALAQGIDRARVSGARTIVVSMGVDGACSPELSRAVMRATRRAVIVAAAGNDPERARLACPARLPGVVSVGGLDDAGMPALYASRTARPTIWALGRVDADQGSSFAAPRVAGVVAGVAGSPAHRIRVLRGMSEWRDGRRILSLPARDDAVLATPSGAMFDLRQGATAAVCIDGAAPDPKIDGVRVLPGALALSVAPGNTRQVFRVTGAPGVRVVADPAQCTMGVTS
jgi:hypothetical protein